MTSAQVGLALALVAAMTANLGSLLKHRGCQRVAAIDIRRPLHSARGLAGSRWFAAGWGLAALAWLIHVAALSMAPISLVQSVLAAGAVTLAVMSQGLFGERVARRQWLALLLGASGLALLALTFPHFSGSTPTSRSPPFSASREAWPDRGRPRPRLSVRPPRRPARRHARRPVGHPFRTRRRGDQGIDRHRRSLDRRLCLIGRRHRRLRGACPVDRGRRASTRRRDRDDRPDGAGRQRSPDHRGRARLRRSPQRHPRSASHCRQAPSRWSACRRFSCPPAHIGHRAPRLLGAPA